MFLQKFVQSAARGGFAAWRRGATSFAAAIGLSFAVGAATVDLAELSGDVILADGDGVWYLPSGESANFFRLRLTEK